MIQSLNEHTSAEVSRGPCPNCTSSDGYVLFDDNHSSCFVCRHQHQPKSNLQEKSLGIKSVPADFRAISERKLSSESVQKYAVGVGDGTYWFPYYDHQGRHVANKLRGPGKTFRWEGVYKHAGLFGQQLFESGSRKFVTVVEGEFDALAAYEMNGGYPVVSVKSAGSAPKDTAENFEYLNGFETIVLCFDRDEPHVRNDGTVFYPGQEAALAVAAQFPLGKVRILTLKEYKDANDYLINARGKEFVREWWDAPTYTPTGLKLGRDMWDEISKPRNYETVDYPWESLNRYTYGIRLSEVVLVTAETGVGKTSVLKEIEHHLLNNCNPEYGIGLLHIEEPNSDTALGLMSITANKPLHLPDVREGVTKSELREYYDSTVNTERIVIWDHFGSNSIHEVLAKIRHMVALGCKYIVVDHLSIIVSDQSGDERKQLDEISTKLKTLCMETNCAIICIIHQNRRGEIRSSAGPEQLANIVLKLTRTLDDADEWRRNVTKVSVQKNRFCGKTGPASYLFYDGGTGRLRELTHEEVLRYEDGGSLLPHEIEAQKFR